MGRCVKGFGYSYSPLERKRNVPFKQLLQGVAVGVRDEDSLTSLAGRLARLDRRLGESDRSVLEAAAGQSLPEITQGLLAAFDPDEQIEAAKQQFNQEQPTPEQLEQSREASLVLTIVCFILLKTEN